MTLARTRELLGDEVKDLSDKELLDIIASANRFCDTVLDIILDKLLTENIQSVKKGVKNER